MRDSFALMDALGAAIAWCPGINSRAGVALLDDSAPNIVWLDDETQTALETALDQRRVPIGLVRIFEDAHTHKILIDSSIFKELRGDAEAHARLSEIARTAGRELVHELREYGPVVTYPARETKRT